MDESLLSTCPAAVQEEVRRLQGSLQFYKAELERLLVLNEQTVQSWQEQCEQLQNELQNSQLELSELKSRLMDLL